MKYYCLILSEAGQLTLSQPAALQERKVIRRASYWAGDTKFFQGMLQVDLIPSAIRSRAISEGNLSVSMERSRTGFLM